MVTTVIRIPEDEYRLYKELARERGESLAEYFRKAARITAGLTKKKSNKYSFWNIGTTVVAKGGPKDGSINTDKYLYEELEAEFGRKRK